MVELADTQNLPAGRQAQNRVLKNMYFVYAIKSIDKNYIYVGLSKDIYRRFKEHNTGNNRTTKPYRPFIIFFQEQFETRIEAKKREKFLKSGCGKEYLKSLL